jgi:transposase
MSLRPQEISPVPEETARVARAANPKGNVYMRDELGSMYEDQMVTTLFPRRGQPAEAPWCLALVTVMQYMEGLSDRQAAEGVRERIDWKYALWLELTDAGFDFSVLTEFGTRLWLSAARGGLCVDGSCLGSRAASGGNLTPRVDPAVLRGRGSLPLAQC